MSEIKVNKISPKQTCTQLTLGDSGDTIIIPSGATIQNCGTATGFGRTGTVNWDTTVKTTGFTAVNGTGYFCDTSSAAFTATLPATPTAGNIVAFKDYAKTWNTNNLTIGRNGSNIEGTAGNSVQNTQGQSVTLIYVDSTKGWVIVDSAQTSELNLPQFVTATGGTVTTCGCYKIHTFNSSGCFVVSNAGNPLGSITVDYMVIAGGGAGGCNHAGGGGAGGFRQSYPNPATGGFPITATTYPITVGGGGAASRGSGSNSVFSSITSAGGGGGANDTNSAASGGSGGGGHRCRTTAGTGNTPPVSPSQGNPGGNAGGPAAGAISGGGGGGANTAGVASGPTTTPGGNGGTGTTSTINGTSTQRAGGGGGGAYSGTGGTASGGGGAGGASSGTGTAGTSNTGGGGGGGSTGSAAGGAGGSGIVVIRYKYQ